MKIHAGVWLGAFVLVAAGCKSKSENAPTAQAGSAGSGSAAGSGSGSGSAAGGGSAVGSAAGGGSAVGSAVGSGSAVVAAVPGCDGWNASKTEWMGMGQISLVVACTKDKPTITFRAIGARDDDDAEPETKPMTREAWNELWRRLDAVAGWRTLAETCAPVATPPESTDFTDLEVAINDGKTVKQVKCEAVNLGAAHEEIRAAFDDAAKAAGLSDE